MFPHLLRALSFFVGDSQSLGVRIQMVTKRFLPTNILPNWLTLVGMKKNRMPLGKQKDHMKSNLLAKPHCRLVDIQVVLD